MKKIIMTILILISFESQGSLFKDALILAAMDSGPFEVKQYKYTKMLNTIEENLPLNGLYEPYEFISLEIPKEDQRYYLSYFNNHGYNNVSTKDNRLHLKKGHSSIQKKIEKEYENRNKVRLIPLFVFIFVLIAGTIFVEYIEDESEEILKKISSKTPTLGERYCLNEMNYWHRWKFIQKFKKSV